MSVKGEDIFMRLFVFFDLPVNKKEQRKIATKFRNELVKEGFTMLQFSVYCRFQRINPLINLSFTMLQFSVYCRCCRGQDVVNREIKRIKSFLPSEGNVRILQVTDKQYGSMQFLTGIPKKEEIIGAKQLVLF